MNQGIALGLFMGWLWSLYLNGPLLHHAAADWQIPITQIFLGFIFCHAIALQVIYRHNFTICVLSNPLYLYSAAGLVVIGSILPLFPHLLPGFFGLSAIIGVIAAGSGSALLLTACGVAFSRLPVRNAAVAFVGAVIFGTLFFFVINLMPRAIHVIAVILMPAAIARRLSLTLPSGLLPPDQPNLSADQLPAKLKILLAVIYTAGGLMHKSVAYYSPSPIIESYWITNIVYCLICMVGGGIIYKFPNIDLRLIYRPVVPLLATGFILFPTLAANYHAVIPFTFLQAGFAVFDLYTWLLFIYLANFSRHPHKTISQGMFYTTFFIFFGEFLFTEFSPIVILIEAHLSTIMSAAAIILVLSTLIFRDERESFSGWTPLSTPAVSADTSVAWSEESASSLDPCNHVLPLQPAPVLGAHEVAEEALQHFMANYHLTPREKEILLLLAKGRNNPFITEHLNISANTLKTHLRNLYRKCEVKNRQELLNMLDS